MATYQVANLGRGDEEREGLGIWINNRGGARRAHRIGRSS